MAQTASVRSDENCTKAIATGLRRHGIDVTTTPEAGLLGATDEEQSAYAIVAARVLVTQDRDMLRISAAGSVHAGIAYCEKDTRSIGEMISALMRLWEIYEPEELVGRIEYL